LHYLLIAPAGDEVAIRVFLHLKARHGANSVQLISSEELVMAPRWKFFLDSAAAQSHIELVSGLVLESHAIGAVYQRIRYAQAPHFTGAAKADLDYAVSEMHALLLAWLASLPCRVTNPPHPMGLGGMERRLMDWLLLGAQLGLPVVELEWTSTPEATKEVMETLSLERRSVLVAGDSVLGDVPDGLDAACVRLAKLAGCTLLEIFFARAGDHWRFCGATPYPADPERVARALELIA
jgi:hypothetical protein